MAFEKQDKTVKKRSSVNMYGRWYRKYTPYRKNTLCGGCKNPQDPTIYGYLDCDVEKLLPGIEN
jgi:hypothetical protein